jgi:hypothetical protein
MFADYISVAEPQEVRKDAPVFTWVPMRRAAFLDVVGVRNSHLTACALSVIALSHR